MSGITVVEVSRSLDMEPVKPHTWSVGAAVAKHYVKENGVEPPKENRQKTSGAGVHCFAIYPESYRALIAAKIRAAVGIASRPASGVQGGLF